MKFTVIGASGFIGSHLASKLRLLKHDVVLPARNDASIYNSFLGNVVYAAGITADFRTRPFETLNANTTFLASILEKCNYDSLLYLSSTRIYTTQQASTENSDLHVNPNNPSDLYNISKLMGESICLNSNRKNVRIARLANVVGPHQPKSENFLDSVTSSAMNGHVHLMSQLDSEKNYISLQDAIELLIMISLGGVQNIYNIATEKNIRHEEWLQVLRRSFDFRVTIDDNAKTIVMPRPSIDRLSGEFNFKLTSPLDYYSSLLSELSTF